MTTEQQQRLVERAIAAGYYDPDHDPDPELVRVLPVERPAPKDQR